MEQRGHVILVDDEPMVRQSTEQWLSFSGFAVDSFADAESALAHLDVQTEGVLITDVRMPGMDGLELLSAA